MSCLHVMYRNGTIRRRRKLTDLRWGVSFVYVVVVVVVV